MTWLTTRTYVRFENACRIRVPVLHYVGMVCTYYIYWYVRQQYRTKPSCHCGEILRSGSGHALFLAPNPNLRRAHAFYLRQLISIATGRGFANKQPSSSSPRLAYTRGELIASLPAPYPHDLRDGIRRDSEAVERMLVVLDTTRQGRRPCTACRYWRNGLWKTLPKRCGDRLESPCFYVLEN